MFHCFNEIISLYSCMVTIEFDIVYNQAEKGTIIKTEKVADRN